MLSQMQFLNGFGRPSDPHRLISRAAIGLRRGNTRTHVRPHTGSRRRRLAGTSKVRQKATLIFRAMMTRLRTLITQRKVCPRTHRSSFIKCSKRAASQQHVGIGTDIDRACSTANRELKNSDGSAVAAATVNQQPPASARARERASSKRPACLRLVPPDAETLAKGHFDISS